VQKGSGVKVREVSQGQMLKCAAEGWLESPAKSMAARAAESRAPRGLFLGLTTLDLLYNVEHVAAANEKVAAHSQQVFVGGPATNAAAAFAHLAAGDESNGEQTTEAGSSTVLVSAVGVHPLAAVIRAELATLQVQHQDLAPSFRDLPAISSIMVDACGQRAVVSANGRCIRVEVDEAQQRLQQALCCNADLLEVDGHLMVAAIPWAACMKALGKPVVFDGGSWKPRTEQLLTHVNTAICSADFHPPGCVDEASTVSFLQRCGVGQIAITQGAGPVRYWCSDGCGELLPPRVEAVDTTGAGDIFHGAYCYYAARGCGFVQSLERAAQVAAASCRTRGTRAWMAR
jgi:sugar/nucleoside kinase (ribokinase family)